MHFNDKQFGSRTSSRSPARSPGRKPYLIAVAGGTASGKSTVCKKIMEEVCKKHCGSEKIISLSQESFYRELSEAEKIEAQNGAFNFDHPNAFDHQAMIACLKDILARKTTQVPTYNYVKNCLDKEHVKIYHPSDVVIVEGILIFYYEKIREMFDMKLFVDTDADTRLARRVRRDIEKRGRNLSHVLTQYITLVKPAFEEFCLPTKKYADVIIPRGSDNDVAISLIVQRILQSLNSNSNTPIQEQQQQQQEEFDQNHVGKHTNGY